MEGDAERAKEGAESAASMDQLLVRTAEEEEMEAQGLNSSCEAYDDDFLIMEEVNEDDDYEAPAPEHQEDPKESAKQGPSSAAQQTPPEDRNPNPPSTIKVILLDDDAEDDEKGVDEMGGAPVVGEPKEAAVGEKEPTTDSAAERAVVTEEEVDGGTKVADTGNAEGTSAGDAEEVFAESEVVDAGEKEEAAEADGELTLEEKKAAAEDGEAAAEEDEEVAEEDEEVAEEGKEVAAEEDKGAAAEEDKEAAVEEDKEAAVCESMDEDAPTIDLCSEADEREVDDMDEEAVKVELKGDDHEIPPEESEAGKENESPILNGGDVVGLPAMGLKEDLDMEQVLATEPKKRRRLASSGYSSLAELKKALGVTDGSDAAPDGSKRIKFEDGAESDKGVLTECKPEEGVSQTPPPVGIPVGPNLVVLSRAQLEAYVAQRVRECLALQGQALLQPMEKKCETLHRALERWRRRSFQLQKQLNEFVCEQERCAGARRNRVMQRSVGVCVRMPPLKQQPTLTPIMATSRPTISTANSTVAAGISRPAQPTPGMVQQVRMTGASASNLAAQLGFKPNQAMKLVTVSTPSGGTTTVVTRMPPQLQVASPSTPTSMPVPVQLIANTGTPSQQVKSVSLPSGTTASGTVVRTVAVVSSASSTPSTVSQTVKFIDLTQEEEGHAKVISMPAMSMAGNTVQKISMPSSAIPVLSAAPTSLVQVTPSSSQPVLRAATAVSSGVVTQAGGSFRLTPSMMAQPRVTYLVPSLPPGMVVTPKESGPRIISGAPGSGTPMPMQTILLRMASPQGGFTTVPGNAITMGSLTPMPGGPGGPGTTMMVQAPAGSQVRMIRAPPPLSLPRGGTTLTLPPGTTLVRGPPNQGGGVTLVGGTPVGGVPGGPASASTTTVRVPVPVSKPAGVAEATRGSPVVPVGAAIAVPAGTSVLGKVDTPASATAPPPVAKHPAPLPPTARYLDDPKKKRLPPKPALKITKAASAKENKEVRMDQVLEQWQAYLNTGDSDKKSNGAGTSVKRRNATTAAAAPAPAEEDGGTTKPARRLRLPYHTLRPLRLACLCRLGTCRYDKLSAAFKERLHSEFGRLRPERQLRLLVARMYSEGLVRSKVPRKGRCKWMYWMPACEVGRSKERVCKAGFMAVHGISEKRVRDVQLLWMRLRRTRGSTPTGEESELENESYLAELVEVEDKELKSNLKSKPLAARRPHPRRKILRETSSEDSSRDAEDEYDGDNSGPDAATIQRVYQRSEEARRKVYQRAAGAKGRAATSAAVKKEADETQSGEETEAADGYGERVAADGGNDDDEDDEEEAPFMDISAFEPICSLEEDSENLVLSLPRGLVLSWNMTFNSLYAEIQTYQLYAYQETGGPPATSHWKKVGDVRALPLPMACTLTQFVEGHKYHFAVRAVDIHNRLGPFSEPSSILLK